LLTAPFAVGGDSLVNPADFRVTTFAGGLNTPTGMMTLPDGSILVAVSNGASNGFTGKLLRLTDVNHDGIADNAGTVLANNLPSIVDGLAQAGNYILATSIDAPDIRISFLHVGATPVSPLTLSGSIHFSFPNDASGVPWEHKTYSLAVRPSPAQPGDF